MSYFIARCFLSLKEPVRASTADEYRKASTTIQIPVQTWLKWPFTVKCHWFSLVGWHAWRGFTYHSGVCSDQTVYSGGAWCHTIQYTSHQTHTSLSILPISLSLIAIYLRTIIVQGFPIWINRFCVIYDNMISVIHTRQGGISKHRQVWEENKHTPNLKAP